MWGRLMHRQCGPLSAVAVVEKRVMRKALPNTRWHRGCNRASYAATPLEATDGGLCMRVVGWKPKLILFVAVKEGMIVAHGRTSLDTDIAVLHALACQKAVAMRRMVLFMMVCTLPNVVGKVQD